MVENEEKLKNLLMRMSEEKSETDDLKLYIQNTKIMVSSPITSWQIDGETMESKIKTILFLRAPKLLQMVTSAMKLKDACSLEEKL